MRLSTRLQISDWHRQETEGAHCPLLQPAPLPPPVPRGTQEGPSASLLRPVSGLCLHGREGADA